MTVIDAVFEKIYILSLGPLYLELESLYSQGTDLRWINCWIQNINKIRQPFRREQGAQPTYLYNYTDIPETTFS
jgi:hypothetical protein